MKDIDEAGSGWLDFGAVGSHRVQMMKTKVDIWKNINEWAARRGRGNK
jgi:hypothetical protein